MSATNEGNVGRPTRPVAPPALPTIEIRFTATIAWLLIGFGAIFFVLALAIGHRSQGLGLFIAFASMAGMVGGNYWRQHLPVVARMTPRVLDLRGRGTFKWSDIAEIEKKSLSGFYRGMRQQSDWVCIKLHARPKAPDKYTGLFNSVKFAALGYDVVLGESELSCTADWFIAECRNRMANVAAATPSVTRRAEGDQPVS
jgi:hypothetical protein